MTLELSAEEVLTTTRSVRRRLNLEKEVSAEVLRDCLDIALQAPTGSLRQDWHFVVSTDRDQCREVGTIYQEVWTAIQARRRERSSVMAQHDGFSTSPG